MRNTKDYQFIKHLQDTIAQRDLRIQELELMIGKEGKSDTVARLTVFGITALVVLVLTIGGLYHGN